MGHTRPNPNQTTSLPFAPPGYRPSNLLTPTGPVPHLPSHANRVSKPRSLRKPLSKTISTQPKVITDVLLAVRPDSLEDIVGRKKNHEFRKYCLPEGVIRLWLYETSDGEGRAAITHIAVIPEATRLPIGSIPIEPFGRGNAEFNMGQTGSKFAYPLLELYELVKPVSLMEARNRWDIDAPVGWRYVHEPLWQDRWGSDPARDDKVKKLF